MSATENKAPEASAGEPVKKHNRRQRASVGGFKTRLDAPQKKGMVRRWVNDDPGRIQAMHDLGYDFADDNTRTDSVGSRIERHVGTHANGAPKRAFLMETPQDQYAIGVEEKEERLKPFEDALRQGQDTTGKVEESYSPKSGRSTINNASG